MDTRVIAIGDIHGCANALRKVVELIEPQPTDTLIPLGDAVDRGPDSRQVIDELLQLRDKCQLVPLLGNHEEMMLTYLDGKLQADNWLQFGGAATLKSYGNSKGKGGAIPDEHVDFIRSWGDYFETISHFFAHACYEPDRPLNQQHWQTMRWQSLKLGVPEPHVSGKTAVVGHTSLKDGEIIDLGYLVCIDTYCWGGRWLTALDAKTGQVWQVDRDGRPRTDVKPLRPAKPS
jgi:serine/threonine protein phosphatase 1